MDPKTPSLSQRVLLFLKRTPIVTLAFAVCALAALSPAVSQSLQIERSAVIEGEWWRVATGHFTHWSFDHFLWDVGMLVVLGVLCESRHRARFVAAILAAVIAISSAVLLLQPSLATYRGASGIDTVLFAMLASLMLR